MRELEGTEIHQISPGSHEMEDKHLWADSTDPDFGFTSKPILLSCSNNFVPESMEGARGSLLHILQSFTRVSSLTEVDGLRLKVFTCQRCRQICVNRRTAQKLVLTQPYHAAF